MLFEDFVEICRKRGMRVNVEYNYSNPRPVCVTVTSKIIGNYYVISAASTTSIDLALHQLFEDLIEQARLVKSASVSYELQQDMLTKEKIETKKIAPVKMNVYVKYGDEMLIRASLAKCMYETMKSASIGLIKFR